MHLNYEAKTTSVKNIGADQVEWRYSDQKVDILRTYQHEENAVRVNVSVKFKDKAPEKAYLNLVSKNLADDPEERDREIFYFSNSKIERSTIKSGIEPTDLAVPLKWFGAGNRYFVLAVIPDGGAPEKLLIQATSEHTAQASLQFPIIDREYQGSFRMVFVPKEMDLLRKIDPTLDSTVDLGFFTVVAYPILWTLKWIYKYVGNYGVAIIILTILIKILTFPLTLKSVKGMRKMAEFQPKMKALQEKYKGNKEALNREMMAMMKGSGYNPMAGCLPMLVQMPVFFALYSTLYAAVELYQAPFAWWLTDLSVRDPYFITPIVMTVVMFVQQKLTPPSPGMDPTQQKVLQFMPLMFGVFMISIASGLCLYMLVNAVVSIIQQLYLNKKLGVPGHVAGATRGA